MTGTETPLVEIDESPEVLTVTLDRPETYNALNPEMVRALEDLLEARDGETGTGLLLRGAGPATCAGVDRDIVADPDYEENHPAFRQSLVTVFDSLRAYPGPTALAGHGAVVGAGVNLAVNCDFVVLGEETTLRYPEIGLGIVSSQTMAIMASQIGDRLTKELVLTGAPMSPDRAAEVGLVNAVVPEGAVQDRAMTYLEQTVEHDPALVAAAKRTLDFRDPDTFWNPDSVDHRRSE